jgi:peptidoglycan/xylan/chitin deacetylase (PgdA/CDA1 family)
MKNFCKTRFLSILRMFCPKLSGTSVLMYHSVGNNSEFFTVTKESFEKQMKYLKDRNFSVISLRELADQIKNGKPIANTVAITFDDGYKDNIEFAYPVLKKYGFPAAIFVTTGSVGEENFLSADDLKKISLEELVEIFPHSITHPKLSKISFDQAKREIEDSRRVIESITGKAADIFAYPYGDFSSELVDYLKKGNWRSAVSVYEGVVKDGDDIFTLKRNSIDSTTIMTQFKAKVSDAIEVYNWMKNYVKSK